MPKTKPQHTLEPWSVSAWQSREDVESLLETGYCRHTFHGPNGEALVP